MMNYVFIFSVVYVMGFIGLVIKLFFIYGGLGLIFSGCVGCGLVLNFGGWFLGLMVFLIYLGGMLVVFGYIMVMVLEEYFEMWGFSWLIFGGVVLGVLMELGLMLWFGNVENVELVVEFNNMGDWVVFEGEEVGLVGEDGVGVLVMYSCVGWMVVVVGWFFFVSIFIIIEIICGN